MDAKDIRELLQSQRTQKFRKYTDAQLVGFGKRTATRKAGMAKGLYKESMEAVRKKLKAHHKKNKKMSDSRIESMNAKTGKPVMTAYGRYPMISEYQRQHPLHHFDRDKEAMPHLYYFIDKGPGKTTYEKILYTPYGKVPNQLGFLRWMRKHHPNEYRLNEYKDRGSWFGMLRREYPKDFYFKTEVRIEWRRIDNLPMIL